MRLAFVLPRFGPGVVGGAELLGWRLAEKLAEHHEVEILTTCALNHYTWVNELEPGTEAFGKITVRRFLTDGRDVGTHSELERAIVSGMAISKQEQLEWLRNGVASSEMETYLREHGAQYDLVLALPYLFGTTYFAFEAVKDRSILIPCLHDEPYARLEVMGEMLRGAKGLMFNSEPEAVLAESIVGDIAPHTHVGMGFDPFPASPPIDQFKRKHGLDKPFILYVGRREGGKNTPLLISYFERYLKRRGHVVDLVFVGSGDAVPRRPGLKEVKDFDWDDAPSLYGAASVFCQPSVNESFSIVMMQSWLAGTPVVVNGGCAVTRFHCESSNGGLWFESYAEFEEVMDRVLGSQSLRSILGVNGREYVQRVYSWDSVLARFEEAASRWRRSVQHSPAQVAG